MHEEIVGIIREVCGKDIDEDMSLFGDLQMDSVEMIELVLRIEEKYLFDFESYDELMNHMDTVKDFSNKLEDLAIKSKNNTTIQNLIPQLTVSIDKLQVKQAHKLFEALKLEIEKLPNIDYETLAFIE